MATSQAPVVRLESDRGPLAVLGNGCRFPAGGADLELFWTALAPGS